jgi:glutamate 5-kinase
MVNLVDADLFVNLTSAGGCSTPTPTNPAARQLECIEDICGLDLDATCSGKTADGNGGMYSKLLAADAWPSSACRPSSSRAASSSASSGLRRRAPGHWVRPAGKRISHRKFWLAYNDKPVGTIVVDAGAARALTEKGKSLLPAGIREVEGTFGAGALVRIVTEGGKAVAVCLTNYKAADLRRIMGHKSADIAGLLGACPYPEAVHRDNMLPDAAL